MPLLTSSFVFVVVVVLLTFPTTTMSLHPTLSSPPMLTSTTPGTWAHDTMSRRIEADILARLQDENSEELSSPEFASAAAAISSLREEIQQSSVIRPISGVTDPDISAWNSLTSSLPPSTTYLTAPWLTAEFYVYRRVLEAFDYFSPSSPTHMFDPFVKQKRAGLVSSVSSAEALLGRISKLQKDSSGLQVALLSALWGNKMDLSIWPADSDGNMDVFTSIVENAVNNLLWDDTPTLIPSMLDSAPSSVHIIVDNAGFELVTDLALASYLISSGIASTVTFQLKGHPTFVSDAMESDLLETVEHFSKLASTHPNCAEAGERWGNYLREGKWLCREDYYWCQPFPMWKMSEEASSSLKDADYCFVKGDANYRRLLGDCAWDYVTDSFQDVVGSYFPCPVIALRTLKAEVGCGMDKGLVEVAKSADPNWQVNGNWGVVQFGSGRGKS
mmetsp:Transcript_20457/g.42873  ORF Transcript_20457/g.42873 Transcript_20457/m.42873 type:complete len:445 (-) Transcript_20457:38-1372(-)